MEKRLCQPTCGASEKENPAVLPPLLRLPLPPLQVWTEQTLQSLFTHLKVLVNVAKCIDEEGIFFSYVEKS